MTRQETEPEWIPSDPVTVGHVEAGKVEREDPVAVLWVPDIDARHRWREYAVMRPAKPGRPFGFRKPGTR